MLQALQTVYGQAVGPEDLFAYCYALLQSPQYVQTFWDELTIPGPRVPLTNDHVLFVQAAALGRELISLHTYGERFVPQGKQAGQVPPGNVRIAVGTPTNAADYPESFAYDAQTHELRVGKGVFSNVHPDVWNFSVSGLQVVRSWLGYRMRDRAGKSSSPLDDIRPATWQFDDELLDLLWVLEATLDRLPQATTLLQNILAGPLLAATTLPTPKDEERRGSKSAPTEQMTIDEAE